MGAGGELTQATEQSHGHSEARPGTPVRLPDRWLAARVQRMIEPAAVRLELWDGSSTYPDPAIRSAISWSVIVRRSWDSR